MKPKTEVLQLVRNLSDENKNPGTEVGGSSSWICFQNYLVSE